MTKVFISYRFSDIPEQDLHALIDPIYNLFINAGINTFCNLYYEQFYKDNNYSAKDIMNHCFIHLSSSDFVICLVDTDKYSCGMLLEIGYALALKKSITVFNRIGCEINTLMQMTKNIKYDDYAKLLTKIKKRYKVLLC